METKLSSFPPRAHPKAVHRVRAVVARHDLTGLRLQAGFDDLGRWGPLVFISDKWRANLPYPAFGMREVENDCSSRLDLALPALQQIFPVPLTLQPTTPEYHVP